MPIAGRGGLEGALYQWQAIHDDARADPGVLSTEIDYGVGEDAVLVHHVFAGPDTMVRYFDTVARRHVLRC